MKNMLTFAAVVAMMGVSTSDAQARLLGHGTNDCGASKCCDCAPTFQPVRCKPTIVRPCHTNVYNYQRTCAKPMCCDALGCSKGCCPVNGNGCGTACVDPNACAAGNGCGTACVDPNACVAGNGCGTGCVAGNGCLDPNSCCPVAHDDACKIAQLIYESQTACYARQRAAAIHRLGDRYSCCCHPEIMAAFIYALNDSDERVRAKAADEIGDQIRRNHCCCTQCVVSALCNALADCDRVVRREAEQALRLCGYQIVNGNCRRMDCCVADTGCAPTGCTPAGCAPAGAPAAVPTAPAAPMEAAPAPPSDTKAYFPNQLPEQNARPLSVRRSLSNLFGLAN